MYRQTIYFPLALYANNSFGTSLDVFVDSPTYDVASRENVPYLDVTVAYDDGTVVINVVNRHLTDAIKTEIVSQKG